MLKLLLPRRSAHILHDEWEKIRQWSKTKQEAETAIIRQWEEAVAAHACVPYAAAVNSGRAGMTQILKHLGITSGDEVIVPAYTLKDLIPLIQQLGATVVPADVDYATLNVTGDSIAQKITSKTKAVVVLHAFGAPAPMPDILEHTDKAGIPIIEDCAHALGATLKGKQVGSFGYAGFFSFEMTKPVNTYGGGMVVSHDSALTEKIQAEEERKPFDLSGMLKKVDATKREMLLMRTGAALPLLLMMTNPATKSIISAAYRRSQHVPAPDVRYSPLQARLGLEKLAGLNDRIHHRQELAALYAQELPSSVHLQQILDGALPTWYFATAILPVSSAPVRTRMMQHGVDAAIREEIADDCGSLLKANDCPNAKAIFDKAIALPMFDGCCKKDVLRTAKQLAKIFST